MKARTIGLTIVLAAGAAGGWLWWKGRGSEAPKYRSEAVTRGPLEATISATGTLEATETVEVGSQVSGTLASVAADFNDHVRRGQVLATLDTEALDASVVEASAAVERAVAQLAQARADQARNKALFEAGLLAASAYEPLATAVRTAEATVRSSQAGLERAQKNRRNAVIVAPVDGVVLERSVDSGQTVAASFTAPKLFVLARDLGTMRILADVDEGDIGQIRVGQAVRFTVAAYPGVGHEGKVEELRLQPRTVQNVVTYTVVVSAPNPDGKLLPGMTATVDFVVDAVADALLVPSAALRFKPETEVARAAFERRRQAAGSGAGGEGRGGGRGEGRGFGPGGGGGPEAGGGDRAGRMGGEPPPGVRVLWKTDAGGLLSPLPVKIGLSDGRTTAVEPLRDPLEPGDLVVTGVQTSATATPAAQRGGTGNTRRMPMPPMF